MTDPNASSSQQPAPSVRAALKGLVRGLRRDNFLLVLLAALPLLAFLAPNPLESLPGLVDWPTIAALTGLLLLTKGLEVSGALHRLGVAGQRRRVVGVGHDVD